MRGSWIGGALLCAAVFLFAPSGAWALDEPETLVRDTADRMLERLRNDKDVLNAKPQRLYQLVEEIVVPHFDFERMAQWVLGKHWRQATAAQQQRFINEFRTLLVRTYATSLSEFKNNAIRFLPKKPGQDANEVTVRTEVEQGGGTPIPINYDMHQKNGVWKVYDVAIDGVSLVANYRTSFGNEIRKSSVDALIKTLAEQNHGNGNSDRATAH